MNIWKEEWAYIVLLKVKRMFRRYRGLRKTGKMAQRYRPLLLILLLMLLITGAGTILVRQETEETTGYILPLCQIEMRHRLKGIETETERMERVRMEAEAYDYPENVKGLLDKNPETIEFVENYRLKKDQPAEDTIGDSLTPGEIPLLLQWDERWGYALYGNSIIAVSGCGPTCMAMVAAGLNQDPSITPAKTAEYSAANGYLDEENNTYWAFMEEACANWNLRFESVELDEAQVAAQLMAGHPIICSMGPGDFTQNGHFIVLTGYADGNVTINDPFSMANSERTWTFAEIRGQIKAMWAYALK